MRKETTRSLLFGLTQENMAMILRVPRSLWSHYEGNRRDLPNNGNLWVQEMIKYMSSPKAKALKSLDAPECQDTQTKPILEKRLSENEFQLTVVARKIEAITKKFEKYPKAVELMSFLTSPEEIKKAADAQTVISIQKESIANYKDAKSQLTLFEIDQELLQQEKSMLEAALKKLP